MVSHPLHPSILRIKDSCIPIEKENV